MDISKEQAEGSLGQVQAVTVQTRKKIAADSTSPFLILWGAIWFAASLVSYFSHIFEFKDYCLQLTERISIGINAAGMCWIVLVTIGMVVSWIVGVGKSPTKSPDNKRWLLCWLILCVYGIIWVAILQPRNDYQIGAFFASLAMFIYVVMGLWADRLLLWLGVVVTLLIVSGFFLFYLQPAFWLWLAVLGGGTLGGTGLYIRKAWR